MIQPKQIHSNICVLLKMSKNMQFERTLIINSYFVPFKIIYFRCNPNASSFSSPGNIVRNMEKLAIVQCFYVDFVWDKSNYILAPRRMVEGRIYYKNFNLKKNISGSSDISYWSWTSTRNLLNIISQFIKTYKKACIRRSYPPLPAFLYRYNYYPSLSLNFNEIVHWKIKI